MFLLSFFKDDEIARVTRPVTDLRIGQIGHGPGSRAFAAPRNSLWRLLNNFTFAKLRRGITSQFTLKRAKMQTFQYSNNRIILFFTQHKNGNSAFHRSSQVSGGLALLGAFCQWKVEHQVRKCCLKGLMLRNMAGRERDAGRLYTDPAFGCFQLDCQYTELASWSPLDVS